jgi:ABC-type proline/glycine betaine transport system permease subunit
MLAISLIIIGILLRFIPHTANFTPVAAIALFAGVYLNKKQALIVPLLLMVISDIFLGMHNVVIFTWGSFILVTLIGSWAKNHKTFKGIVSTSLVSSFLFYVITNFGVWAMGWYPQTAKGLLDCYILGLPFLRTFTVSTLAYTVVFFGAYELIARRVRDTKLAKVLL